MPQLHSDSLNLYSQFYEVRRKLNETSASYWTNLEIFKWLNQGQSYIVRKSKCLKKEVTITTTSGTQEYDLRTTTNDFSDIMDISEDGVYYLMDGSTSSKEPLEYTTKWKLNKENTGWRSVASNRPNEYYYDKATKTIGLYPKPNASNAGAYLVVSGYHWPKVLNAGTAAAGDGTTLTLAIGSATVPYPSPTDDYYNNLYMEIYQGTGAGEQAKITDYTGSTRKCTVNFTATPSTDSIYGMIPQIPQEAHYLMTLYAFWHAYEKGGSRIKLAGNYQQQFYQGLGLFIGEGIEEDDESLVKNTYR